MQGLSRFKNGPATELRLKTYVTFTPLGLPKAQPFAYIENINAILSQLRAEIKSKSDTKISEISQQTMTMLLQSWADIN